MKKLDLKTIAIGLLTMDVLKPTINEYMTKARYNQGYQDGFKACLRAHNVMLKELFRKKVS